MNKVIPITIKERIKDAIKALKGKPNHSMTLGIEVKRCSDCESRSLSRIVTCIQDRINESQNYGSEMEFRAGLYTALAIIEEETKR